MSLVYEIQDNLFWYSDSVGYICYAMVCWLCDDLAIQSRLIETHLENIEPMP